MLRLCHHEHPLCLARYCTTLIDYQRRYLMGGMRLPICRFGYFVILMTTMSEKRPSTEPYKFTEQDLTPDRFTAGAEYTLESFYNWRDNNPDAIASHIDSHAHH